MPASPLPSLESVDTLLQSPQKEQPHSDCLSQRNSGLLEAILYESQTLKNSSKNPSQQALDSFLVPGNLVKSLPMNPFETATRVDPNSPLGHSAASVFSEYTPVSGSSMDEHQSVETMLGECLVSLVLRCSAMPRTVNLDPTQYVEKQELSNEMDITRPDAFLDLDGFGHCNEHDCDLDLVHRFGHSEEHAKDESLLRDDIWGTSGWRT
ncbi:hypothetical protein CJ030_MR1G020859 [Morella rubra]|uniref:Uncharacterized protein n=1 Tax=Morella rubra TaxID=262757 RepID=A0A6A1WRY2_9ROSI|nr:hypothetical protein CJ030_MR1G020859 [Morella rubra]